MSGNDGGERRDISDYDGDDRGDDISVDNGIHIFRSQETSHSYSLNCGETVHVDWIGGYMYHTSHYSYHNPVDHGILLNLYVSPCCVHKFVHEN